MASLNIPFLLFSKCNFEFETRSYCHSEIIDSIEDGLLFAHSNIKGEVIFYDFSIDQRTIRMKVKDSALDQEYRSYYHLMIEQKLLLIPSINEKEACGFLKDSTLIKSPSPEILVRKQNLNCIEYLSLYVGHYP